MPNLTGLRNRYHQPGLDMQRPPGWRVDASGLSHYFGEQGEQKVSVCGVHRIGTSEQKQGGWQSWCPPCCGFER
jgi:hypothetical protein